MTRRFSPRPVSQADLGYIHGRLNYVGMLLAIADSERRERERMSAQGLRQALRHLPGASGLTVRPLESGRQAVTIGESTVDVDAAASPSEIAAALAVEPAPAPSASLIPPVTLGDTMTTSAQPGSFAANLKAIMDEARANVARARSDGLARVNEAVGKLDDAKTATIHVSESMAKTIEDEAASVMAELGQISNDLGV